MKEVPEGTLIKCDPRKRLKAIIRLQEIEGNPLTADEIAMFEMFERESWPHEKRREYILAQLRPLAAE